ncbi:MAG: hypothetical protein FWD52_03890 [Candidatus Bathyarchaeota archaeon]|nr:hypothetical protein [Candidatus Termiticorpusculum sp.]
MKKSPALWRSSSTTVSVLSALTYDAYTHFFIKISSNLSYTSTLTSNVHQQYLNYSIAKKICHRTNIKEEVSEHS